MGKRSPLCWDGCVELDAAAFFDRVHALVTVPLCEWHRCATARVHSGSVANRFLLHFFAQKNPHDVNVPLIACL
jgi:hypothetical protein